LIPDGEHVVQVVQFEEQVGELGQIAAGDGVGSAAGEPDRRSRAPAVQYDRAIRVVDRERAVVGDRHCHVVALAGVGEEADRLADGNEEHLRRIGPSFERFEAELAETANAGLAA
jgi:hypothetical protein